MGTVTKHLGIPCDRIFETNLFAAEADPKKVRSPRVLGKAGDPPKVPKPNVGKAKLIFAGPCAQGMLDPSISHVPSAVLILLSFLEHPRGPGSKKCDPRWIPGRSLVDPW